MPSVCITFVYSLPSTEGGFFFFLHAIVHFIYVFIQSFIHSFFDLLIYLLIDLFILS